MRRKKRIQIAVRIIVINSHCLINCTCFMEHDGHDGWNGDGTGDEVL